MSLNLTYKFEEENSMNISASTSNVTAELKQIQQYCQDTFDLNIVALISITVVVFLWLIMTILAFLDEQSLSRRADQRLRRNNNFNALQVYHDANNNTVVILDLNNNTVQEM